jgi:site-specific DNA recombinase
VLNNELYRARIVWNRQRFLKDPGTGKRLARINPREAWIVTEVPSLRIIDDELWNAVTVRQANARVAVSNGLVPARRPKHLLSGLTVCETCGGGFTMSSQDDLRCFNAGSRGTWSNRRSIRRQEVESRVLRAMREEFLDPVIFATFCDGFDAEMNKMDLRGPRQLSGVNGQPRSFARRRRPPAGAPSRWKARAAQGRTGRPSLRP